MNFTLIAVFGVFQIILFLMHADIYKALVGAFGLQWPWLLWVFAFLSITFVTSSVFAHRFCNGPVKWYYRLGAYWFGATQFLFIGSVAFFILERIIYGGNHYVSPAILGIVCLGGTFLIHTYATLQTRRLKFSRVTITLPHLPEYWRGKKIAFVSDVHLGAVLGSGFSTKVVNAIKPESVAAVLIGGDIFDGVKCHSESLIAPFRNLSVPDGVYFATGNHEYIEDTQLLLEEIPRANIRILKNEVINVKGLQLAGVDWKDAFKKEHFESILAKMKIDRSQPSILMRHEPSHLKSAEQAGISVTLCGHTHAGQIWPLGYVTHYLYKGFDYGLKKLDAMMVYTSSGVGTWGPPLRFGTKSEIVIITLQ